MSELDEYIRQALADAFNAKLRSLGFWCPRCDLFAPPLDPDAPVDGSVPGWCLFCGLDPRTPGTKPKPAKLRGIA